MIKTVPYSNCVTLKVGGNIKDYLFKMPTGYTNFIGTITITPMNKITNLTTMNVTVEGTDKVTMQGCIIHNKLQLKDQGIPIELSKVVLGGTDKVGVYLIDQPAGTEINIQISGVLEKNDSVVKAGSIPLNTFRFDRVLEIYRVTNTNTAYTVMDLICSADPKIGKGTVSVYKSSDSAFLSLSPQEQEDYLYEVLSPFEFVHHRVSSITIKPGERLYVKSDITGVNVNILRMEIDGRIMKD